jgi:hypothetical protein
MLLKNTSSIPTNTARKNALFSNLPFCSQQETAQREKRDSLCFVWCSFSCIHTIRVLYLHFSFSFFLSLFVCLFFFFFFLFFPPFSFFIYIFLFIFSSIFLLEIFTQYARSSCPFCLRGMLVASGLRCVLFSLSAWNFIESDSERPVYRKLSKI